MVSNKTIKCKKCGKAADKFGHYVELDGGLVAYYHWDCYDKRYNNLINAIIKDAHKDDK